MPSIRFLGAAGTVTSSRFLIRTPRAAVLVDAGLFQGPRELGGFERAPRLTLLVHGEPTSLAAAASRLDNMGWTNRVPAHMEEVTLP